MTSLIDFVNWDDFQRQPQSTQRKFLDHFTNLNLGMVDEWWPKYRLAVASMPLDIINKTNFYDMILEQLWRYVDVVNGSFSRWNGFGNDPESREKYMKRLMEIAAILKGKGVHPSCPTNFAKRYAYFRSLEKTAGQAARLYAPCADKTQAGRIIAESPLMKKFYWRPGGVHDRVWDPVLGESSLKRKYEEDVESLNKRGRISGGKRKSKSRSRRRTIRRRRTSRRRH